MAAKSPRIGYVGVSARPGSWSNLSHVPYLKSPKNTAGYKIVALQNSSKESAEKAAKIHNFSDVAYYDNPAALAADPNVDIVAVSVKVPSHFAALEPALKAKKDVFSEWPLARNLEEAEHLTTLARENGVRTLVGLQARQNPSIIKAKQMVEAGDLGEVLSSTFLGWGMTFGETTPAEYAYGFPVEAGVNMLTIAGGHNMDAVCYVLGELQDLQATLANMRPTFKVTDEQYNVIGTDTKTAHDVIAVTGHLINGGGILNVHLLGGMNPVPGAPNVTWAIYGTKGTLILEAGMGVMQMWQPKISFVKNEPGAKLEEVPVEQVGKDFTFEGGDFSYAVGKSWEALAGKGDGTVTTFEDALVRHRMIDAIYRSNETGKRQSYV